MAPLRLTVIKRLLLAWLLASTVLGSAAYLYEVNKIDDQIVELAAHQSRDFLPEGLPAQASPGSLKAMRNRAREFVGRGFVMIEVADQNGQKLAEAIHPQYENVVRLLAVKNRRPPHDSNSHYERFELDGTSYVQVVVPLPGGFFEGLYAVSPELLHSIHQQLEHTLLGTLAAILATTLLLYPVIVSLNRDVMRFSHEVIQGNLDMASVLGSAIALRDSDTGAHNYRVTLYAIRLAEALHTPQVNMKALILGAFLHDVGKIGIRDSILLKPGKLTDEEFAVMRTHVTLGVQIVSNSPWLESARDVIECHHEKFNGRGYPKGLRGEDIPLVARLFAVVDVFDALASRRPYKEAMPLAEVMNLLMQESGTHFDPVILGVFRRIAADLHGRYAQADEALLREELNQLANPYYLAPTLHALDTGRQPMTALETCPPGSA